MGKVDSLTLEFLGDNASLIEAINGSVSAMGKMQAQSAGFASSIANAAVRQIAPITAAVASAFAANKALKDYAGSNLPGATAFSKTVDDTKTSIKSLSEAIGEFLAPGAIWAAKAIQYVTDKLTPLVRQMTALWASSKKFFLALGQNILDAFRPILPSVFAVIDTIVGWFDGKGGKTDWKGMFNRIRAAWNATWNAILNFTAPIIVALSALFETIVATGRAAFESLRAIVGDVLGKLGDPVGGDGAMKRVVDLADIIQTSLLTAIISVDLAIQNWRLGFDTVMAAGRVAIEYLLSQFKRLGGYVQPLFSALSENLKTIMTHLGGQVQNVFETMGTNIAKAFSAVLVSVEENFKTFAINLGVNMGILAAKWAAFIANPATAIGFNAQTASAWFGEKSTFKLPDFSNLSKPKFEGLPEGALRPMPGLPDRKVSSAESAAKSALDGLIKQFGPIFGPELQKRIADAIARGGTFADLIRKMLPFIGGKPKPSEANTRQSTPPAALIFGTAQAFAKEANDGQKNPHVRIAEQQLAVEKGILAEQKKMATNTKEIAIFRFA